MIYRYLQLAAACLFVLSACGQIEDPGRGSYVAGASESTGPDYVVMGADLQQLKDDFNASKGRVRLVFLSGPTCGICLRGMADFNDEFIAASQNDNRLVTYVVHVPTMGAKEHHAADSIPLLDGPRVHHYWEESGIIGQHFTEIMDVDMYVWDFWAIYAPDAVWTGTLPPVPDYYEHQLGSPGGGFRGFPVSRKLDTKRCAAETGKYLERVDAALFATPVDFEQTESERLADGMVIPHVGQPRSVAVSQHILGRGGYKNLKRIQSVEARGSIEAAGVSQALIIRSERPNSLRRFIGSGTEKSVAALDAEGTVIIPPDRVRGLPVKFERMLFDSHEFDGPLVEWPERGHELSMTGMQKFGHVLAWQLDLVQNNGRHWQLFIDSHSGDMVRARLLAGNGDPMYSIHQSDFRETSGFMFPHRIEHMSGAGEALAIETIDSVVVDVAPFELEQETIAH